MFFITLLLIIYVLFLCVFFFLPIHVAKDRDLSQHDRSLVKILTWCSIFTGGTTWFIALCLAFFLDENNNSDAGHDDSSGTDHKFRQNYF